MDRVEDQAVDCNEGGIAVMARKDVAHKFAWFDEGLVKMRANGDYDWLCKNNAKGLYSGEYFQLMKWAYTPVVCMHFFPSKLKARCLK